MNQKKFGNITKQLKDVFIEKAQNIIDYSIEYTVYNIDYVIFENDNILSIGIRSYLKEGNYAQRTIIQTFNYKVVEDELITLDEYIKIKSLNKEKIEKIIKDKISLISKNQEELKKLGYSVFLRDINNNLYNIQNTTSFIIDDNGYIYIIFPYGNDNFTTEMDLVIY